MNREILTFVNLLEGYKTAIKSLHWNSNSISQHEKCDEIANSIANFQDVVSEVEQSISGNLPFNKLKGTEYKITNIQDFIKDVITNTKDFHKKLGKMGDDYIGLRSECETFLAKMQRLSYLINFTLKESFKRNYKKKINESSFTDLQENKKSVTLTESQLSCAINEAINNVVSRFLNENGQAESVIKGGVYNDKELDYTHFAVNKVTHLVVDGWSYAGYDSNDLRDNKNEYFDNDLRDNGFNPKMYKILSFKGCQKQGIDPNNKQLWSNTGVYALSKEMQMQRQGQNPFKMAREEHPDWFVEN